MEVTLRQDLYGTSRVGYQGFILNYTTGKFWRKVLILKAGRASGRLINNQWGGVSSFKEYGRS